MSLTYRLNKKEETIPHCATPDRMPQPVNVAVWKDALNVRSCRKEEMVAESYEGKLRTVRLQK
jgi:hypothetical protein